ncbi:TonB-dependent receptor plug domain-containing protein [Desulfomicrobium salsuginis]
MRKKFGAALLALWLLAVAGPVATAFSEEPPLPVQGVVTGADNVEDPATEGGQNRTGDVGIVYRLDAVNVVADRPVLGKSTIEGAELQSMPSRTGTITEALKVLPNVQFSNEESGSLTMGEVRPPRVSISGAKPYENNFRVDGMSVSNTLDPSGIDKYGDVPSWTNLDMGGADQTFFHDELLLDSVTVYTSNVPVKYGNFIGGVVDAETRRPRTDRWHALVEGRHTRSEWFDLRGVDEDSDSAENQPKFRIHSLQTSADGPVTDRLSLLFAYARRWSDIPLRYEEADGYSERSQHRTSENFFAKALLEPASNLTITLDATYAPYSEARWRPSWLDSDWAMGNEALRLGGSAKVRADWGTLTGRAAYAQSGFSRDSKSNVWYSDALTNEKRGGVGDGTSRDRNLDAGLELELPELATGDVFWRLSTGVDVANVTTNLWNEAARVEGLTAKTATVIDYFEYDQENTLNTVGCYLQAEVEWGRLTLTPGLRLDYDDFSFNRNVAPRFKAELDTMGDGTLTLVAGASRYYGGQLRAYAFDRYRPNYTTSTNRVTGIQRLVVGNDRNYEAKGLNTPHSDELMGGFVGMAAGFDYSLELVHRDHRDQLVSKTEDKETYQLTNDGKSTYDGITASLSRAFETERFGTHTVTLGATKSRLKTFDGAYDGDTNVNLISGGYPYDYDRVYYEGQLIARSDLPGDDFNAPLVVTLDWLGSFYDERLRLNCVSRWRDSTTGLVADKRVAADTPYGTTASKPTTESSQWLNADGGYNQAYRGGVISGGLITDVSLEFDVLKEELLTVSLLLDVYNVFSADPHTGVADAAGLQGFVSGRGYYAGVRCEF